MPRFVAFLQGINLGATRKVAMGRLTAALEDLGYDDVATFLNSGNVAFTTSGPAASHEREIERALAAELGFEVDTFVRSAAQLRVLAEHDPFPTAKRRVDDQLHVTFLRKKPSASAVKAIAELSNRGDRLVVEGRELWHLRHGKLLESTLPRGAVDNAGLGPGASRNISTVRRLADKLAG